MIFDASAVEDIIGYSFKDKMLLRKCFTHSSFANEHGEESNERLEFFGDAVLELVVTEHLFQSREQDEGVLTDLRQKLVSKQPLLKIVKKQDLTSMFCSVTGNTEARVRTKNFFPACTRRW